MQIDLDRAGVLDGEADGLDMSEVAVVSDSAVLGSDMTWGSNPRVDFDNDGSIHITWFESTPAIEDENSRVELRWTRILSPQLVDGEMPLGRTLDQAYGVINTRVIATSNDNLMGVFGTGLDTSSQPIVNFDWPNRDIIWTTPDCSEDTTSEDKWDVCMWSENVYNMAIELDSGMDDEITLQPGQSADVGMLLRGIKIPGGSDIVVADASESPEHWQVEVGFSHTYQSTTTLVDGSTADLDLFIRAPDLRYVNEDQSFELSVFVTSSSKDEATTSKTFLIELINQGDWNDDDGDGVLDYEDDCQFGESGWTSDVDTDHDGDGCRDSTEDLNDDNDDYPDVDDSCPSGFMGDHIDLDGDGCDDVHEDPDNDGDGIENHLDLCPNGAQYWASFSEDNDGDGCRDADEDDNDDNDPYLDVDDDCPSGMSWWNSLLFDHDGDGCHDIEDTDDNNDQIPDLEDLCPTGMTVWFSEPASDYDNDGFSDWEDACIRSSAMADSHMDGDGDGCDDNTEDNDLDNDGIESAYDNCEGDPTSTWVSTPEEDYDSDGCIDSTDFDDDGDGISDEYDACPLSVSMTSDFDRDGCDDATEDWDDDGDGVPDSSDRCPLGLSNWDSSSGSDIDGDGCMDSLEDDRVTGRLLYTLRSNAFMTLMAASVVVLLLAGVLISSRRSRVGIDFSDQTWAVEDSLTNETKYSPVIAVDEEDKFQQLSDVGYSPEAARAILESEDRIRNR